MAGKKKRRVSRKTLDILRKGREKLARMRKAKSGGKKSRSKPKRARSKPRRRNVQTIILGGGTMDGRKRRSSRRRIRVGGGVRRRRRRVARRMSGGFEGMEGIRRRRRRRSHGLLMGAAPGNIGKSASLTAVGIAGALAAAYANKMLPVTNAKVKTAIPLIGGILLSGMAKNSMLRAMGLGMSIVGGAALVRQLVPTLPMLGEDEQLVLLPDGRVATMGTVQNLQGKGGRDRIADLFGQEDEMEGGSVQDLQGLDEDLEGADDEEEIAGYLTNE